MSDSEDHDEELTEEELELHDVEELPDREAMSIVRGDVTIPIDPDIAADVLLAQDASEGEEEGEAEPDSGWGSVPDA